MEKIKRTSENQGITLIALIITIVVMLILVAVTVQLIIESDLISITEEAANMYNTQSNNESNMNGVTIGDKYYNSLQEYADTLKTETELITFTVAGDTYTVPKGWTWEDFVGSEYDTSSGMFQINGVSGYSVWYGERAVFTNYTDPIEAKTYSTSAAEPI